LKAQIASTKKELDVADVSVKHSEEEIKNNDPQLVEADLRKAQAEYRVAVNGSQLHSYTAMIRGKAVSEVSDSEVKNVEKYLILIPSIAAAFASTLIAVTAVRRSKASEPTSVATIPDEAAKFLFGPLISAIRVEAKSAVAAAIEESSKITVFPKAANG